VVFIIIYFRLQSIAINDIDGEMLDEGQEYAELINEEGIEALLENISERTRYEDPSEEFYRVITFEGETVSTGTMEGWGDPGFYQIPEELLSEKNGHSSYTVTIPGREGRARIFSIVIGEGMVLQMGEVLDEIEEYLNVLLLWFLVLWSILMFISVFIGWFISKRALKDMKDVTETAREISHGEYEKRVKVKGQFSEIEVLGTTFNDMLDRIQNLLKTMREVNDNIAHDLRSPLARIRGIAEMSLLKETTSEQYRAMAASTIEECDNLIDMINTMLDITEIESGIMKNRNEEFSVVRLIENAWELFRPIAEEKDIRITTELPDELNINADRKKLQRIVSNLLDNAIKYTPEGGSISILVIPEEEGIKILFEDTGIGIPEAEIPHIFERFYRCDVSRSQQGVGLGLSLARALSESMNGIIKVTSILNKGSRFVLYLPDTLVSD